MTETTNARGMRVDPYFCPESVDSPFDTVEWETRTAQIKDENGGILFEQNDCSVPKFWSALATNVVVSKYFYGEHGTAERENSVRQVIHRVSRTIADWGFQDGYFASADDCENFYRDLTWLLLHQHAAFNSPVWFNVGLYHQYGVKGSQGNYHYDPKTRRIERPDTPYEYPQASACFIQSVDDSMDGIMRLATSEALLFKFGSGTGTDLSTIRSSREKLSGGGTPSGPLSFMRVYDQIAAVVKSGGKCLAAHQPVYTAGGVKTAKELAESGKDFVVLSYSKRLGRAAAKTARAWKSGRKVVVSVKTDKGEFHVSEDHPFMLRTGEACSACHLKPGMSLMAVSALKHTNGYIQVTGGTKEFLHRMVMQDIKGEDVRNKVVHHIDGNILNNNPDNLELMESQSEHARHHNLDAADKGEHVFQNRQFPKTGERNGMHRNAEFWKDTDKVDRYKEKQRQILKDSGRASDMQKASAIRKMLNTGYELINAGYDISTFEKYVDARKAVGRRCPNTGEQRVKFDEQFGGYDAYYKELRTQNHEVLSVTVLGLQDVYSVEVDDPEPDDKRDWSEHNYSLGCIGNDTPYQQCVVVLNTRRAAKMQSIKDWHPDVLEFIECKSKEEKKAHVLIASGEYDSNFNGEAYSSIMFQNANLSVRVSDEFMQACENGEDWTTHWVTDPNKNGPTYKATDMLRKMAEGTWQCGDPGVQYDSTINTWHTCKNTGPINASNPCCFVGETLVDTSEGRIRIDELVRRAQSGEYLPLAYVHDVTSKLTIMRPIRHGWEAGKTDKLVKVTTDKGVSVVCTPEHKFLTCNEEYVEAKYLTENTILKILPQYVNDRVLSVEEISLETPVPVYDLEIEDIHNFAVSDGTTHHSLFVSNSEYMFLDDTACNLSSINLKKMLRSDGTFDVDRFRRASAIMITAQEILVDHASYPTPAIAENSHLFRPLGLGYANLGSLLMTMGIPYDSDAGRGICGAITAIMTGQAYLTSSEMAKALGTFEGYNENEECMLHVMQMHRDAVAEIDKTCPTDMYMEAVKVWDNCLQHGIQYGYRNSQVTVLAPTGTIAFMMDCDTTGIEPDIALIKYKQLAGGGMMKIINRTVPNALRVLGYDDKQVQEILEYLEEQETVEGAPHLEDKHLPVFDCAFKAAKGTRTIPWEAHVKMMAAAQPFLSGAISKTVNMPQESTVEDIEQAYMLGWKLGLKALAVYRDGSKQSQPLSTTKEGDKKAANQPQQVMCRRKLPSTRKSVTHKFNVGGHEGYVTVGLFEDGSPGELFITMAKEGSTIGGLMDVIGTETSLALQYGVPISTLVQKFSHARFEPSGWTDNPNIPMAKSVIDYIFRWMGMEFDKEQETTTETTSLTQPVLGLPTTQQEQMARFQTDAPACGNCGSITVRNGSCYLCHNCGTSMGCS